MPIYISGHKLTLPQIRTLDAIKNHLVENAQDSNWCAAQSRTVSPKGDGRSIPIMEIFPIREFNQRLNIISTLDALGVLAACEISFKNGGLKGVPYRELRSKGGA